MGRLKKGEESENHRVLNSEPATVSARPMWRNAENTVNRCLSLLEKKKKKKRAARSVSRSDATGHSPSRGKPTFPFVSGTSSGSWDQKQPCFLALSQTWSCSFKMEEATGALVLFSKAIRNEAVRCNVLDTV